MLITTPEASLMTYQFDSIVRDQKSHRIITTDHSCIIEPPLWFSDIWYKIRTDKDFGARKQISLNAFYLFEKGGGRIMPYEGNVGSYMLYGGALKSWLRDLFNNLETYVADYSSLEVDLKTPYRWIDIYITPKNEKRLRIMTATTGDFHELPT